MSEFIVWDENGSEEHADTITANDAQEAAVVFMEQDDQNGNYTDGYPDGLSIWVKDQDGQVSEFEGNADWSVHFSADEIA